MYKQECPDRYQSSHGLLSDTGYNMSCPTPKSISHAGKYNPIYKAMYRMGLFEDRFVRPNPCSHYEDMWYHYLSNDDIRDRYIQKFRRIYEAGIIPIIKPVIKLSALKFSGSCHVSVTGPCNLSYSYDGIRWYALTELYLNGTVYVRGTLGKATESVYSHISADGLTITGDFGDIKPTNTYYKLFEGSKVMFEECALTYNAPYAYHSFLMNATVSGAPYLPETLYEHCFEDMYYSANVFQAPILPETPLAPYCYYGMFEYSTLSTPPEIPNNNLVRACYQRMFRGCTNLITTPELYASALAIDAYNGMYYGCSNVNEAYIYCDDEYINTDYTRDLLNSVAPVGTLYCAGNRDRNLWKTSTAIPDGWLIKNINAWITVHGDNCTFLVDGIPLSPEESILVYTNVPHTIECITDDLHKFVRWDDDLPLNPREVTLDTDTEFTAVIQSVITVTLEGTDCYFRFDHVTYTEPVVTINGIHLIECIPPANYRFVSWSDGSTDNPYSVDIPDTTKFVATTIRQYNLYITGVDCIFTVDGDPYNPARMYDTGEHVIQVFTDKDFITWADTLTHENPRTINLIEDSAYAVTSDDLVYIQILPRNCTITIDGTPFVSGYYYPGVHELIATPNTGYEFTTWSDDVTTASRTINATSSVSLIAQADLYYDLIAPVVPHGSYKFNDTIYESLNLRITSGDYIVEFIEEPHYEFVKWDINTFESTSNPLSFYLGEDTTITPTTRYYDTLTLNGINTTFKVGSDTVTSVRVYTGSTTVIAVPTPTGVWRGWEDGVMDLTRTFTITEDTEITATTDVTVTITLIGEHCNLLVDGVAYTEPVTVNAHTPHNISCVADSGYIFYQWSGDYTSKNNPTQLIVHDSVVITAEVYDEVFVTIDNDFQFTVGSSTYQAPYTFRVACGVDYTITPIIVDDAPNYWWQFDSWSDGCLTKTNIRSFTEDTLLHANCTKLVQISFVEDPLCTFYYDNILYTEPIKIPAGLHVIKCVTDTLHTFVKWVDESIIRVLTSSTREVVMPVSFEFEAEIHEPMTVDLTVPHGSSTIGGVVATHREVAYYRNCVIAWVRTDNYTFKEWQVYFGGHYSIDYNASMEWCMADNIVATAVCYDPLHYYLDGPDCSFTVNSVVGATGEFGRGDNLTIECIPPESFVFESWSDGSTDNPRVISNQIEDLIISATTREVLAINLTGPHCTFKIDGEECSFKEVLINTSHTIECIPDDLYIWHEWSDHVVTNPRTVLVTSSLSLSVDLYAPVTITLVPNSHCTFKIDDEVATSKLVEYNSTHTIECIPTYPYTFNRWSDYVYDSLRTITCTTSMTYSVQLEDPVYVTINYDADKFTPYVNDVVYTSPVEFAAGESVTVRVKSLNPALYTFVSMLYGQIRVNPYSFTINYDTTFNVKYAEGLVFEAVEPMTIALAPEYDGAAIYYNNAEDEVDGCTTRSAFTTAPVSLAAGDKLIVDGDRRTPVTSDRTFATTGKFKVYGLLWSLDAYDVYLDHANSAYASVFAYTDVVDASGLKLYRLNGNSLIPCYDYNARELYRAFYHCESLVTPPEYIYDGVASIDGGLWDSCFESAFEGCISLTSVSKINSNYYAGPNCLKYAYKDCTSLVSATDIGSGSCSDWGSHAFYGMFQGCTSLVTSPNIPLDPEFVGFNKSTGAYAFASMYVGCTSLTTASQEVYAPYSDHMYESMYEGCANLTTASGLMQTEKAVHATNWLGDYACYKMFKDCTSLTNILEFHVGCTDYGFASMYQGCTSLTNIDSLSGCYIIGNYGCLSMFEGCTSVTNIDANFVDWDSEHDTNRFVQTFKDCTSVETVKCMLFGHSGHSGVTNQCMDMFVGCNPDATFTYDDTYLEVTRGWIDCNTPIEWFDTHTITLIGDTGVDKFLVSYYGAEDVEYTAPFAVLYHDYVTVKCITKDGYLIDTWSPEGYGTSWEFYAEESTTITVTTISDSTFLKVHIPEDSTTSILMCHNVNYKESGFDIRPVGTGWGEGYIEVNPGGYACLQVYDDSQYCSIRCEKPIYIDGDITAVQNATGYSGLFKNCIGLTNCIPFVVDGDIPRGCFKETFLGCTGLTSVPSDLFPVVASFPEECFSQTFQGSGVTNTPVYSATEYGKSCFYQTYYNCTDLVTGATLPATTYPQSCCIRMYSGCTGLTDPGSLAVTYVNREACDSMYYGCTSLTTTPSLTITTLLELGCNNMFMGCTSLTSAANVEIAGLGPLVTDSSSCSGMFQDCTSLVSPPVLSATNLTSHCYYNMFKNCTSLVVGPVLPATSSMEYCYYGMFQGCTSLQRSPDIEFHMGEPYCCASMFQDCTSLTTIGHIVAFDEDSVYWSIARYACCMMFRGCTSLTGTVRLRTWGVCYEYALVGMFADTNISALYIGTQSPTVNSIQYILDGVPGPGVVHIWLADDISVWESVIPDGWTVVADYTP